MTRRRVARVLETMSEKRSPTTSYIPARSTGRRNIVYSSSPSFPPTWRLTWSSRTRRPNTGTVTLQRELRSNMVRILTTRRAASRDNCSQIMPWPWSIRTTKYQRQPTRRLSSARINRRTAIQFVAARPITARQRTKERRSSDYTSGGSPTTGRRTKGNLRALTAGNAKQPKLLPLFLVRKHVQCFIFLRLMANSGDRGRPCYF